METYNPFMMLKVILFSEMLDGVSYRELGNACKNDMELVYVSGKRKTPLQRQLDKLVDYLFQLYKCAERINICGDNRNSYSKTDHDATMMHMKEDYYGGTNLFKVGYNVQLGVSDEYIMNVSVVQDRNDQNTLIHFLEKYQDMYGFIPNKVVEDSGYGSYDNYMYLTLSQRKIYIKFHSHKTHYISESENTKGKYLRINFSLSTIRCLDCPVKELCTKAKGYRIITHNPILEEFHEEFRINLSGEDGKRLKDNKSYQSEGAFAILKSKYGKERFRRRGMKSVTLEMTLSCIGYNLMKYHNKKTIN